MYAFYLLTVLLVSFSSISNKDVEIYTDSTTSSRQHQLETHCSHGSQRHTINNAPGICYLLCAKSDKSCTTRNIYNIV